MYMSTTSFFPQLGAHPVTYFAHSPIEVKASIDFLIKRKDPSD